jgi:hypothetical protein
MKIRMITLYAGPDGVMQSGRVYDVEPPTLAKALVEGRYAVMVEPEKAEAVIETAVQPAEVIEKAVAPEPRKRGRS